MCSDSANQTLPCFLRVQFVRRGLEVRPDWNRELARPWKLHGVSTSIVAVRARRQNHVARIGAAKKKGTRSKWSGTSPKMPTFLSYQNEPVTRPHREGLAHSLLAKACPEQHHSQSEETDSDGFWDSDRRVHNVDAGSCIEPATRRRSVHGKIDRQLFGR